MKLVGHDIVKNTYIGEDREPEMQEPPQQGPMQEPPQQEMMEPSQPHGAFFTPDGTE